MPLTLVDLPLELLGFILELIPVHQVEKYALTCKLLFAISSKLIETHALRRAMYTSIYSNHMSIEYRMKPILDILMKPELCVYVRNLSVCISCLHRAMDRGEMPPYDTDEGATTQACDILEQVSQTLPKAMANELWRDVRELDADVVAALALARLVNLTTLKMSDNVCEINHTIDMIGYAALSQRSGGAILQHLTEVEIEMGDGTDGRDFSDSYGLVMTLPSLRKLLLSNIWLYPDITWSQQGVAPLAPLSHLGLFNCSVTPGILREMLRRLQHLKAFVFECDDEPEPDDGVVSMWHVLGIIRESGLQSSLVSLTLKHAGVNGPYRAHIGSLHDFDSLEILETDFRDADVDDSTFPDLCDAGGLCELSAPILETLRLKCYMKTVDQDLQDFSLRFRLLIGKFLRRTPTLRHLDVNCQRALRDDDRCALFRICKEAGVLLSM